MKFLYYIELKEGYKPVMETEKKTELSLVIEAKNRATADRMIYKMLENAPNVKQVDGIALE